MNYPNCLLMRSNRPAGGTNSVKKNCTVAVRIVMKQIRYWSSIECAQLGPEPTGPGFKTRPPDEQGPLEVSKDKLPQLEITTLYADGVLKRDRLLNIGRSNI